MWAKQRSRMQKVHFCLKCLTQKCCWLSSLMMFPWLRQFSKTWWVWWVSFLFCKVFLDCPQLLSFRNRNYRIYLNKHPTSNWRPPRISAQPPISAHPHPTPPPSHFHSNSNKCPPPSPGYHPKKGISTNKRLPQRWSFLQSVL